MKDFVASKLRFLDLLSSDLGSLTAPNLFIGWWRDGFANKDSTCHAQYFT